MNFSRYLMVILAVGAVVQLFYYYPLLPPTLATHFGALGAPDGWATRQGFFAVYLGVIALNLVIFLPLPQLLARSSTRRSPLSRDPEKMNKLQAVLGGFGVLNLALALYVGQLVLAANLTPSPRLTDTILWVLTAYLGVVIAGVIWIVLINRHPGKH